MDGSIGRLHCRYRLLAAPGGAPAVAARLDRVARGALPAACAAALDEALGDDQSVYVLRRVEARVALIEAGTLTDAQIARRWGAALSDAILRGVTGADDVGVVRFADQAEYVARFVADLLSGSAWGRWYYGSFAHLRGLDDRDAIVAALLDDRARLPSVLAHVARAGALDRLLRALDDVTLRRLWSPGGEDDGPQAAEVARPFVATALTLADRLGLWAGPRPDSAALLSAYVASRPTAADWQDRQALAIAVLDVLRFLAERGDLRADLADDSTFSVRIDTALAGLDWLDRDQLRTGLRALAFGPAAVAPERPVRRPGPSATPRQRRLLDDLAAVLRDASGLDRARPDSPANALRLYALLVARSPGWAGDLLATGTIERLIAVWAWLIGTGSPMAALGRLERGQVEVELPTASMGGPAGAAGAVRSVVSLGEHAFAVLRALVGSELAVAPSGGIETECAGLFLLLRAALDAGLPALVSTGGFAPGVPPPLAALLLAVGRCWAGESGATVDGDAAALRLWAGLDDPAASDVLHDAWDAVGRESHIRFQAALLAKLAGQRLLGSAALHLYLIALGQTPVLVAGDEGAALWPLGLPLDGLDGKRSLSVLLPTWATAWDEAAGAPPDAVIADAGIASLDALRRWTGVHDMSVVPIDERSGETDPEGAVAVHRRGRAALGVALTALEADRPATSDAGLTVALTAAALLRLWARWLPGFADSSVPYLLESFVRRPGRVSVDSSRILVELDRRPLDVVLERAGYTADLEHVPWLGGRQVRFRWRDSS